MHILDKTDISIFIKAINNSLSNNLSPPLCLSLANIIAIDYVIRLNSAPIIQQYANICAQKLRSFLGQKVMLDDSFSTVLTLFSIAISKEELTLKDNNNVKQQLPDVAQDVVIETLIAMHFDDITEPDKQTLKLLFKDLLTGINHYEIMNYIQSEPALLRNAVMQAMKKSKKQQEINLHFRLEINKTLIISAGLEKKISLLTQVVSKIVTAICGLAVGGLGVLTAGAALSVVLVPACILAIKYGPKLGEKLGEAILNLDSNIKFEKNRIFSIKSDSYKTSQQFIEQIKNDIAAEKTKTETVDLQEIKSKMTAMTFEPINTRNVTKSQDKIVVEAKGVGILR